MKNSSRVRVTNAEVLNSYWRTENHTSIHPVYTVYTQHVHTMQTHSTIPRSKIQEYTTTDVGTARHSRHVLPTFHKLLGKVPLCSSKSCQFLFMRVPLNTCAPPTFRMLPTSQYTTIHHNPPYNLFLFGHKMRFLISIKISLNGLAKTHAPPVTRLAERLFGVQSKWKNGAFDDVIMTLQ